MKFLILLLIAFTSAAIAESTYIEKSGNKCPPGYSNTRGNYCVTNDKKPKQVLTKTGGKCPPGWEDTRGNYCVNNRGRDDDVIVKSGNKCPPGYYDTRGGYCKR